MANFIQVAEFLMKCTLAIRYHQSKHFNQTFFIFSYFPSLFPILWKYIQTYTFHLIKFDWPPLSFNKYVTHVLVFDIHRGSILLDMIFRLYPLIVAMPATNTPRIRVSCTRYKKKIKLSLKCASYECQPPTNVRQKNRSFKFQLRNTTRYSFENFMTYTNC